MLLRILGSLCLLSSATSAHAAETFKFHVQKILPYVQTMAEPGKSKGLIIEILEGAFAAANLPMDNRIPEKPWPELQELGKDAANSLIAPFGRTPAREASVRWIAPILEDKLLIYAKKGRPIPAGFEGLAKETSIGVTAGSSAESRLKELKIKFEAVPTPNELFKRFAAGKFDVVVAQGFVSGVEIKSLGLAGDSIQHGEPLLRLPLWAATSLKTSDEMFLKAKQAIEAFKKSPEYEKILARY